MKQPNMVGRSWSTALRLLFAGLSLGLLGVLGPIGLHAPAAFADDGEEGPAPKAGDCVKVTPEVRYGAYGYDHLVHLENRCDQDMTCRVKTDVNPEEQTVHLAKGEKRTVVTFRGSPARVFKEDVECAAR